MFDFHDLGAYGVDTAVDVLAFVAEAPAATCREGGVAWTMERILRRQPAYSVHFVYLLHVLTDRTSLMYAKAFGADCVTHPAAFLEFCRLLDAGRPEHAVASFVREVRWAGEVVFVERLARSLVRVFGRA